MQCSGKSTFGKANWIRRRGEFASLAERHSNPAGALTMLGMIFEAQGNPQQARLRYERAVAADPRAAVAANNLAGLYLLSREKLDEALRLARNAAEVLPEAPEILDTLGWAYYQNGLYEVAVGPLVRAVEREPKNGEYLYHLGLAYAKSGDSVRSREMLEQALANGADASWLIEARRLLASLAEAKH